MKLVINIARVLPRFTSLVRTKPYQWFLASHIRLLGTAHTQFSQNKPQVVSQKFTRKVRHNKLLEVQRLAMADPTTAATLQPLQALVKEQVMFLCQQHHLVQAQL